MAKTKKYDSLIYQTKSGAIEIKGDLKEGMIWLNQSQISEIFDISQPNTSRHIKNILKNGEVPQKSNMHFLHIANSDKPIAFYSLDVVLAVGYRTNSSKAISFRKWSTQVLKSYLSKGYAINEKRLTNIQTKWNDFNHTIQILQSKIKTPVLYDHSDEVLSLLNIYARALTHLFQYDQNTLQEPSGKKTKFKIKYENCVPLIENLKKHLIKSGEAKDLFGRERAGGFSSILENIYQTFGGDELYPSFEGKVAHLFYFIIKDHPFSDGNKRIGSFMLIYFLKQTDSLYDKNGNAKINPQALTALALLVAESDPAEKNIMIKLIMNLVA